MVGRLLIVHAAAPRSNVKTAIRRSTPDRTDWRWRFGPRPGRSRRPANRWRGAIAPSVVPSCSRKTKRSEEHTSELQSLMRISYAVFCLKKTKKKIKRYHTTTYI